MTSLLGIDSLDQMMGKVPKGARILLTCAPDVDGRALLLRAVSHAIDSKQDVVYLVTDRAPTAIRRMLVQGGRTDELVQFIDAYSGLLAKPTDHGLADPGDYAMLVSRIATLAKQYPKALFCMESSSSLIDKDYSAFMDIGPELLEAMGQFQVTMVHHVKSKFQPDSSSVLDLFDANLLFNGVERGIARNNVIRLERASWQKNPDMAPRFASVEADGRVMIRVPKIVITGAKNAGKTTFLKQVSVTSVGTERGETTVALDKGRYESADVVTDLFGTPGDRRFDPVINSILEQAAAVILMVDSTNPESFERTHELLDRVKQRGIHVIMAANKQDESNAMSSDDIQDEFGVQTFPCSAKDNASAHAIMTTIIGNVLSRQP